MNPSSRTGSRDLLRNRDSMSRNRDGANALAQIAATLRVQQAQQQELFRLLTQHNNGGISPDAEFDKPFELLEKLDPGLREVVKKWHTDTCHLADVFTSTKQL